MYISVFLNLLLRVLNSSKKNVQMWINRENDQEKLNEEIIIMTNKMRINYIVFLSVQGKFMFFLVIFELVL